MEEIKLFLDKALKKEVEGVIEFDPVKAGETTTKEIYIYNSTNFHMDVELTLEGENISIKKDVKGLRPMDSEKIVFEFTPKLTLMQPIRAKLNIKINYIVT